MILVSLLIVHVQYYVLKPHFDDDTVCFVEQLSSASSADSDIHSPSKPPSSSTEFPLQQLTMSSGALTSPCQSNSSTSTSGQQQLQSNPIISSARNQQLPQQQQPQGEQTWDTVIDRHIRKSLDPHHKVSTVM